MTFHVAIGAKETALFHFLYKFPDRNIMVKYLRYCKLLLGGFVVIEMEGSGILLTAHIALSPLFLVNIQRKINNCPRLL